MDESISNSNSNSISQNNYKRLVPPLPSNSKPRIKPETETVSHDSFIKSQVKSTLSHLQQSNHISKRNRDRIIDLLENPSDCQVEESKPGSLCRNCGGKLGNEEEMEVQKEMGKEVEVELGKRNKWFRETLSESSLLPSLVESVLGIAAGPMLSDDQKEAITQLVEMNQRNLATLLTEPKYQSSASKLGASTLVGTGRGVQRGWKNAGKGIGEFGKRKNSERDEKKKKKEEEKILKKELKEERERFKKEREGKSLDGTESKLSARGDQNIKFQSEDGKDLVSSPTEISKGSSSTQRDGFFTNSSSASNELNSKDSISRRLQSSTHSVSQSNLQDQFSKVSNPMQTLKSRDQSSVASINCKSFLNHQVVRNRNENEIGFNSISTSSFSPYPGMLVTNLTLISRGGDYELRRKWGNGELESDDDEEEDDESESDDDQDDEEKDLKDKNDAVGREMSQKSEDSKSAFDGNPMSNSNSSSRPVPSIPSEENQIQDQSLPFHQNSSPDQTPDLKDRSTFNQFARPPPQTQDRTALQSRPAPKASPSQPQPEARSNSIASSNSSSDSTSASRISIPPSNPYSRNLQNQSLSRTSMRQSESQRRSESSYRVQDTPSSKQSKSESAAKWAGRLKTVGKGIHDMI